MGDTFGLRVAAITQSNIENMIYCFIFSEVNTLQNSLFVLRQIKRPVAALLSSLLTSLCHIHYILCFLHLDS